MRTLVTLVTGLEFAQHLLAVRRIVAILARRDVTMLVSVTEGTLELGMLGRTGLKHRPDVRVAGGTVGIGHFLGIGKGQRLMGLVTGYTVFKFLAFRMRIMTIQAVRTIAVFFMAEGTGETGMRGLVRINFLDYLRVAGVTCCLLSLTLEDDVQRLVRVLVAGQAVGFKFEMGFAFMAV